MPNEEYVYPGLYEVEADPSPKYHLTDAAFVHKFLKVTTLEGLQTTVSAEKLAFTYPLSYLAPTLQAYQALVTAITSLLQLPYKSTAALIE